MPTFSYRVKSADGANLAGLLEANSEKEVVEQLHSQGYWVLNVKPARSTLSFRSMLYAAWIAPWLDRVRPGAMADFFGQLAIGLHAGMTLFRILDMLSTEATHRRLRHICDAIKDDAQRGMPLAQLLGRYPHTFPPLVVAMINAGEVGGQLERIARELARHYHREEELRRSIQSRVLYTKLTLVTMLLLFFVLRVVVPYLQTRRLALESFTSPVLLGALALLGVWMVGRLLLQIPVLAYLYDVAMLSLPWLGGVNRRLCLSRFARALAFLYRSGLGMAAAARKAAGVMGNRHLQRCFSPLINKLEKGERVSGVMAESRVFPRLILEMVKTGEETGEMDATLENVADRYDGEAEATLTRMMIALPVLLLFMMAVAVGYIVIQFYTGYFTDLLQMAEP